ncbi:MAG TPA: Tol-Pal system beta propeller repeat protein TolB [Gammaproteobacteria bacterium]|nr:Tol-Pal system beta propeller repeat protein TolB [Gammaproteobacteria bacterium]
MLGLLKLTHVRGARSPLRSMLLLGALLCGAAQAQMNIVVTQYNVRPIPVAIVPFGWQGTGAPAYDVAGVVTADLGNSGRFAPIKVADMVSKPTQPTQVNFQDWRVLDVDALVIGQLSQTAPGRYAAVFQLFDVPSGEQRLGFRLEGGQQDLRAMSHQISDMVFEKLTGIKGVFSTQIAYVSEEQRPDKTKRYRLIVSDADGENANVVADSPQPLMSPAWSPDARRLAYVSFEGNQSAVYVQTLRSGMREKVSGRPGVNGSPSFSPDGRELTITRSDDKGNLDVFALDTSTQALRQLTTDSGIDTEASWSPDGRTIYFTSDRAGSAQIYKQGTASGARPERVSFENTYNAHPRVSPDGKQIAVQYGQNNTFRIGVFDVANREFRGLTDGKLDESPSFAPNGAQIIYATKDGNRGVLASVSTDGRIKQRIASVSGDVREPVWGPFPRP